ncbi:Protein of unknown function [Gryllus bimaculatus]|nr:Protein of unknown function [Gryllus bimaculatus]
MLRRGSLPAPRKQAGTKAARMLLLIFAWDSCAYFPLLIVTIVQACGVTVNATLHDVSSNLTLLTILADPYIYAYNNQQTKKAIVDFVACFRRDAREDEMERVGRRQSMLPDTSMRRLRHIISSITNTSTASEEEKEKANGQSPTLKRNSLFMS